MGLRPRSLINAIALQILDRSDHNMDWNELLFPIAQQACPDHSAGRPVERQLTGSAPCEKREYRTATLVSCTSIRRANNDPSYGDTSGVRLIRRRWSAREQQQVAVERASTWAETAAPSKARR